MLDRPRPLVLAWAGVCALLFAVLAFLVQLSPAPLNGFDDLGRNAEHWARGHDGLVHVLRWVEAGFATIGILVLTLLLVVPLWVRKHRRASVYTVLVVVTTVLLYTWIKVLDGRDRPLWQEPVGRLASRSFPSGHAASTAALAGVVIVLAIMLVRRSNLRRAVCVGAVVVAVLVGADRVLLGRHYPTDVLAGWLLAACVTLFWLAIYSPLPRSHAESAVPLTESVPTDRRLAVVVNPSKLEDVGQFRSIVTAMAAEVGWSRPSWHYTTVEDPGATSPNISRNTARISIPVAAC